MPKWIFQYVTCFKGLGFDSFSIKVKTFIFPTSMKLKMKVKVGVSQNRIICKF